MLTDLAGGTVTETFPAAALTIANSHAPYGNSSSLAATLILSVGPNTIVDEAVNAIDQTAGAISVDISSTDGLGGAEFGGANTYSGGTSIDDAILELGAAGAIGSGGVTFFGSNAVLVSTVSQTLNDDFLILGHTSADFAAAVNQELTIGGTVDFSAHTGAEAAHFGLVVPEFFNGAGVVDLKPSGEFVNPDDAVTVDAGKLIVGNANAAELISGAQGGLSVGTNLENPATLDLNGNVVAANNLTGDSQGVITSNSGVVSLTVDESANSTFSGQINDGAGGVALTVESSDGASPRAAPSRSTAARCCSAMRPAPRSSATLPMRPCRRPSISMASPRPSTISRAIPRA